MLGDRWGTPACSPPRSGGGTGSRRRLFHRCRRRRRRNPDRGTNRAALRRRSCRRPTRSIRLGLPTDPSKGRPHSVATRLAPWRTQSRSGDLGPPHGCQGWRAVYQLPFQWSTRPRSRDTVPAARLCCRKSAAHVASARAACSSRSRETPFLVGREHESTDEAGCAEWHSVRSGGVETSVASVS